MIVVLVYIAVVMTCYMGSWSQKEDKITKHLIGQVIPQNTSYILLFNF